MTWLLDTHILIWWADGSKKLSVKARKELEATENRFRLSVISLWEISLKNQIGKLRLAVDEAEAFANRFQLELLPLLPSHARKFPEINPTHPDPFDRMLAAQAESTPLYLMTQDESLADLSPMVRVFS